MRIACKEDAIPDESTIEKTGQSLLNFLVGFLRVCPPAGKICESVICSTSVDLIISLPAKSHRKLLQSWANPDEANILCSFCSSFSFCPSNEKSIVSISEKLGSTDWPFPIHRRTSTGMTKVIKLQNITLLQLIGISCITLLRRTSFLGLLSIFHLPIGTLCTGDVRVALSAKMHFCVWAYQCKGLDLKNSDLFFHNPSIISFYVGVKRIH